MLITNAYTPDTDLPGGLCATLAQKDDQNQIKIISHASRQLKENKKNYTPFLLEMASAAWGMENFNEYLKGSKFTIYMDQTTEQNLGTTQVKILNRLKTAMSEHNFYTRNRGNSNLPDFLKQRQDITMQTIINNPVNNPVNFNKAIHVDAFQTTEQPEKVIVTITDEFTAYSVSTIINDNNATSTTAALANQWFKKYGYPGSISF